ncbi:hypothetical protein FPQ18DRAFT_302153 [Pyronema domesticum]|nr:hypothetical protein FPQ18DRAFT_302153 [Pyronema domesticum]
MPRFILRKYTFEPQPLDDELPNTGTRRGKNNNLPSARQNDPFIFHYNILTSTLEQRRVSEVYGSINMYRLEPNASDPDDIEKALPKLENEAAKICKRIQDARDAANYTIRLTRVEVYDVLRNADHTWRHFIVRV